MTTTKTPEQVAREVLEKHASIHAGRLSGENALTIATAAIKADRAQRHAQILEPAPAVTVVSTAPSPAELAQAYTLEPVDCRGEFIPPSRDQFRNAIESAIKADRAKRHARHVDKLDAWQAHPRTATSYACATALREILNESR